MMKKVTVAFVGVGGYGATNIGALLGAKREDIEIIATVDPYTLREDLGVPHFKSIDEMYEGGIHPMLAVISTPIRFHTEQILTCLAKGTSVMCEKPMTGDEADIEILKEAERASGAFVGIGYQWSYSAAITSLKADILSGLYGKPLFLKTIVLWPRDKRYFARSTGWAGKVMDGGKKILDSVANNATAHYIHNILYLLGDREDTSAMASGIRATLLRTNDIETFDTVTAEFDLPEGAKGLFIASHATEDTLEPCFEYRFEGGTVSFSEKDARIIGRLKDGTVIDYGDPFANLERKMLAAVRILQEGEGRPACGIDAATPEVRFIAELHRGSTITPTAASLLRIEDERLYVKGLYDALIACYEEEHILTDARFFAE